MDRTGIYACGESVSRRNSLESVVLFSLKQEAPASIGGSTFTKKYEHAEAELLRVTEVYGRKSDEWYRASAKRDYYCNKYIDNVKKKVK